jgi:hypothetical protein
MHALRTSSQSYSRRLRLGFTGTGYLVLYFCSYHRCLNHVCQMASLKVSC